MSTPDITSQQFSVEDTPYFSNLCATQKASFVYEPLTPPLHPLFLSRSLKTNVHGDIQSQGDIVCVRAGASGPHARHRAPRGGAPRAVAHAMAGSNRRNRTML